MRAKGRVLDFAYNFAYEIMPNNACQCLFLHM